MKNFRLEKIKRAVRKTGILAPVDYARYWRTRWRLRASNNAFRAKHPEFALPPASLAHDAYSAPDWAYYYRSGLESASFLRSLFSAFPPESERDSIRILDWGCGPARLTRHLGRLFPAGSEIHGTDYNTASIEWCKQQIPHVHFAVNGLLPPLPFTAYFFDFIYCGSVFTHLSESSGIKWVDELHRVSKQGGIVAASTHGDNFLGELLPEERTIYEKGEIVTRSWATEGKRDFTAFHPARYARLLFAGFDVLAHNPPGWPTGVQDLWVLRAK